MSFIVELMMHIELTDRPRLQSSQSLFHIYFFLLVLSKQGTTLQISQYRYVLHNNYGVCPVNEYQVQQQVIPGMYKAKHTYQLFTKLTSGAFSKKMTSEQPEPNTKTLSLEQSSTAHDAVSSQASSVVGQQSQGIRKLISVVIMKVLLLPSDTQLVVDHRYLNESTMVQNVRRNATWVSRNL